MQKLRINGGAFVRKNEAVWAIIIFIAVVLAFVIPYTVLEDTAKWYGSFLFWTILTIIVIIINYFLTKDWGKEG